MLNTVLLLALGVAPQTFWARCVRRECTKQARHLVVHDYIATGRVGTPLKSARPQPCGCFVVGRCTGLEGSLAPAMPAKPIHIHITYYRSCLQARWTLPERGAPPPMQECRCECTKGAWNNVQHSLPWYNEIASATFSSNTRSRTKFLQIGESRHLPEPLPLV